MSRLLFIVLSGLIWPWLPGHGAEPNSAASQLPRLTELSGASNHYPALAVLTLENRTGDADAAHWADTARRILSQSLRRAKTLIVTPGVGSALEQLQKKVASPTQPAEAVELGRLFRARWVVWGSYESRGAEWLVSVRVQSVETGDLSRQFSSSSRDWFEIAEALAPQVLGALGASFDEGAGVSRRWTTVPRALECLSKARALWGLTNALTQSEKYAREAVAADPTCGEAWSVLSVTLQGFGRLYEAEQAVLKAVSLRGDDSFARRVWSGILLAKGDQTNALRELEAAVRVNPEDADAYRRLGYLCFMHSPERAFECYREALRLNPFPAEVHAELAYFCAMLGDSRGATAELQEAERRLLPAQFEYELAIARTYRMLTQRQPELAHMRRWIERAKQQRVDPLRIAAVQQHLLELEKGKSLSFITAVPPEDYRHENWRTLLRRRLTEDEMIFVDNPVDFTPEMSRWAHRVTSTSTNDLQKAQMLHDALAARRSWPPGGHRTAREVFAAWSQPSASLGCMDYAFLNVALARAVGLQAYCVDVREDCYRRKVSHVCAAVFIGGRALLSDAAYDWFGVPHKQFMLLDDVRAASICVRLPEGDPRLWIIGAKLAPDVPLVQLNALSTFLQHGAFREAAQVLGRIQQLDPDGWMANRAKGEVALTEGRWERSVEFLRKSLEIRPREGHAAALLAYVYHRQGKFKEAKVWYQNAQQWWLEEGQTNLIHSAIAGLDEEIKWQEQREAARSDRKLRHLLVCVLVVPLAAAIFLSQFHRRRARARSRRWPNDEVISAVVSPGVPGSSRSYAALGRRLPVPGTEGTTHDPAATNPGAMGDGHG